MHTVIFLASHKVNPAFKLNTPGYVILLFSHHIFTT